MLNYQFLLGNVANSCELAKKVKIRLKICKKRKFLYLCRLQKCESSSFGRARPCQGRGGRFEPGLSLMKTLSLEGVFYFSYLSRQFEN